MTIIKNNDGQYMTILNSEDIKNIKITKVIMVLNGEDDFNYEEVEE